MTALNTSTFSIPALPTTSFTTSSLAASSTAAAKTSKDTLNERTRATAQDFEAVFINSMFKQMMSGVGEGPYSGGQAAGVWRSFLTDEYAKSFAKAGGIGIADDVQRALLAQQEAR